MGNFQLKKSLLNNLPKTEFKQKFKERIRKVKDENYYQIVSEMRSIYIFEKTLNIPIIDIEVKTLKKKGVDFLFDFDNEKIYVEVKGNESIRNCCGGNILEKVNEIIERAFNRSQNKFLENSCNILIIADENTIKIPLFNNQLLEHNEIVQGYLNLPENEKTSAVIILGGQYQNQLYNYKFWDNPNSQKKLPAALREILDKHKSNLY